MAKKSFNDSQYEYDSIERDLGNILSKSYSLSIGRFYQLLEAFRSSSDVPGTLQTDLYNYLKKKHPELLDYLISDYFFIEFKKLIDSEVFARKRHE